MRVLFVYFFYWRPIGCVVRQGFQNIHLKDKCLKEIGICFKRYQQLAHSNNEHS